MDRLIKTYFRIGIMTTLIPPEILHFSNIPITEILFLKELICFSALLSSIICQTILKVSSGGLRSGDHFYGTSTFTVSTAWRSTKLWHQGGTRSRD